MGLWLGLGVVKLLQQYRKLCKILQVWQIWGIPEDCLNLHFYCVKSGQGKIRTGQGKRAKNKNWKMFIGHVNCNILIIILTLTES